MQRREDADDNWVSALSRYRSGDATASFADGWPTAPWADDRFGLAQPKLVRTVRPANADVGPETGADARAAGAPRGKKGAGGDVRPLQGSTSWKNAPRRHGGPVLAAPLDGGAGDGGVGDGGAGDRVGARGQRRRLRRSWLQALVRIPWSRDNAVQEANEARAERDAPRKQPSSVQRVPVTAEMPSLVRTPPSVPRDLGPAAEPRRSLSDNHVSEARRGASGRARLPPRAAECRPRVPVPSLSPLPHAAPPVRVPRIDERNGVALLPLRSASRAASPFLPAKLRPVSYFPTARTANADLSTASAPTDARRWSSGAGEYGVPLDGWLLSAHDREMRGGSGTSDEGATSVSVAENAESTPPGERVAGAETHAQAAAAPARHAQGTGPVSSDSFPLPPRPVPSTFRLRVPGSSTSMLRATSLRLPPMSTPPPGTFPLPAADALGASEDGGLGDDAGRSGIPGSDAPRDLLADAPPLRRAPQRAEGKGPNARVPSRADQEAYGVAL
ncbi:hypothetical protein MSPP1_004078 [Malassezia sp. CBS 17886]|nr:hypothetical protein MSPP1_004078 [Malassezia sp. CBS 17886]